MIRRSVASFQAEDVGDDVFCIVALDHKVWHGAMRGLERNSQRRARQARRFGNRLEGRGIGAMLVRAALDFLNAVDAVAEEIEMDDKTIIANNSVEA